MRKNILILVCVALIAILAVYMYKLKTGIPPVNIANQVATQVPTPTQEAFQPQKIAVTGVMRQSGLRTEEKSPLNLAYSSFMITSFTEPLYINNKQVENIYLELKDQEYLRFLGQCLEVKGSVSEEFKEYLTGNETINGQYTYKGIPIVPTSINKIELSKCKPYLSMTNTSAEQETSMAGVLKRFDRPAPDISYDYQIALDKPFKDAYDASGLGLEQKQVIIIPSSNDIWAQIEKNMGRHVSIKGYMTWGYAESRYLLVTEVLPK